MKAFLGSVAAIALCSAAYAEGPNVVAGTSPAFGLAARVMDGVGTVERLVPEGADVHRYSLRPSDARKLSGAEVVVWVGPELTPWMEGPVEELATGARHLALTSVAGVELVSYGGEEDHDDEDHDDHGHDDHGDDDHDDHGHDDHSDHAHEDSDHKHDDHDDHGHEDHADDDHGHDEHGHDEHGHDEHAHDDHGHDDKGHEEHAHDHHDHAHDGLDPHAWHDPEIAKAWMTAIAETLAEADPAHADAYRANAAAGAAEIDAAAADAKARLTALGPVQLIVAHDAWRYFERAFDVPIIGALADGHAAPSGAARITELRDAATDGQRVCVLAEPSTPIGLIEAVEADGQAVAHPQGVNLPQDVPYIPALLDYAVSALEDCFS